MLFKWSLFTFNAIFLVLCSSLSKLWKESRLIRLAAISSHHPSSLAHSTRFNYPLQTFEAAIARKRDCSVFSPSQSRFELIEGLKYGSQICINIFMLTILLFSIFWFSHPSIDSAFASHRKAEKKDAASAWDLWNSIRMKNKLHAKKDI